MNDKDYKKKFMAKYNREQRKLKGETNIIDIEFKKTNRKYFLILLYLSIVCISVLTYNVYWKSNAINSDGVNNTAIITSFEFKSITETY
jgi:hypothetical protein